MDILWGFLTFQQQQHQQQQQLFGLIISSEIVNATNRRSVLHMQAHAGASTYMYVDLFSR